MGTIGIGGYWRVAAAVCLLAVGCAQSNKQAQDQPSRQRNETATVQDQATQGSRIDITQNNNNGAGKPVNRVTTTQPVYDAHDAAYASAAGTTTIKDPSGSIYNTQINYIQTGGTTPTATGTTTGGATSQAPNQSGVQTPTQTVAPETSASVPIGVALPGGNVSNQATAAGRGQASGSKSDAIDQNYAQVWADNAALRDTLTVLADLLRAQRTPTSQPMTPEFPTTTQPAK